MKALEARDSHDEDLKDKIRELKEELFNLRFQLATGQLDNHRRLRLVRREIAMIRTILREREWAEAEAAEPATTPAEAPPASTEEEQEA